MSSPKVCKIGGLEVTDCCQEVDYCSIIDRKGWKKVILNILIVLLYQILRVCYKTEETTAIDAQATSSYIFLVAATTWVTALDLQPACLSIWPSFMMIYDVVAVTVFANLLLNYIWSEILLFINTLIYHIYIYSDDTKLGELVHCIFDEEHGLICLADVVAIIIMIWVLCGVGVMCHIQNFIKCILENVNEDDEIRALEEELTRINCREKKKTC